MQGSTGVEAPDIHRGLDGRDPSLSATAFSQYPGQFCIRRAAAFSCQKFQAGIAIGLGCRNVERYVSPNLNKLCAGSGHST